jgi:hypothetical protein
MFVSPPSHVQQFFHLKFYIPTEVSRGDVTLIDKTALLEKIKDQPRNTDHPSPTGGNNWSAEI